LKDDEVLPDESFDIEDFTWIAANDSIKKAL
jgi:hypothetical protein